MPLYSDWNQEKILIASDGVAEDFFGNSVSLYGDYALIGAPGDLSQQPGNPGVAYIFKYTSSDWVQVQKIPGSVDYQFGAAVSLYGDYAAVGLPRWFNNDRGSVNIYHRSDTTWLEDGSVNTGGFSAAEFGSAVSLYSDYLLVGAHKDDSPSTSSGGSAYIVQRQNSGWIKVKKLYASDGDNGDLFGESVSLYGDYALIGAKGDDSSKGSAYIFQRQGSDWIQTKKLKSSLPGFNNFGKAVSLYGEFAFVCADNSLFIFQQQGNDWIKVKELTPNIGTFGTSISAFNDLFVVGAQEDAAGGPFIFQGSAYVYQRSGSDWVQIKKLTSSMSGAGVSEFGHSVSLYEDKVLAGAPRSNTNGNHQRGEAYIFRGIGLPDESTSPSSTPTTTTTTPLLNTFIPKLLISYIALYGSIIIFMLLKFI